MWYADLSVNHLVTRRPPRSELLTWRCSRSLHDWYTNVFKATTKVFVTHFFSTYKPCVIWAIPSQSYDMHRGGPFSLSWYFKRRPPPYSPGSISGAIFSQQLPQNVIDYPIMHWRQLWQNMLPEINPGLYIPLGLCWDDTRFASLVKMSSTASPMVAQMRGNFSKRGQDIVFFLKEIQKKTKWQLCTHQPFWTWYGAVLMQEKSWTSP